MLPHRLLRRTYPYDPAATLGEAQFRFLTMRCCARFRDAAVRLNMVKIALFQKNKVDAV